MSGRKALYFIFLCQAFLQETRSHMIYHVIKGALGMLPQQARGWQLLAIRALLASLFERPKKGSSKPSDEKGNRNLYIIGSFFDKPYFTRESVKKVPIKNRVKMS